MNGDSTRVARIELPDGTPVWARISGAEELSYTDTGFHERVEASVESLHSLITGVARSLSGPLSAVRPDEVSVEFGIELTAKAGKVVGLLADGEAKAALTVTLTWNGGPPEPGVASAGGGAEAGPTGGGTVPGGGTGPSGPAPGTGPAPTAPGTGPAPTAPGTGPAPTAPGAGSGRAAQVPHPGPRRVWEPDGESARGGPVTGARAVDPAPASVPGASVPGPRPAARPAAAPAPEPRPPSHATPVPPTPAPHPHLAPRTFPPRAPEPSPAPRPEALFGVWGHPG
ncbi:CU044_2847 family protein [Streptomyces griseoluteus]|uniref:CU044_2847 family protein n=1 Tax=Streptomyces griseoluteus TaxID=29306 RepID=UPI003F4DA362